MRRGKLLLTFACMAGGCATAAPMVPGTIVGCDQWRAYQQRFIQEDGRVIDFSADDRTTSEAQAYALFFALVAGDKTRFDRILTWTRNNLMAQGKPLPAWLWGRRQDGGWGILDGNSASDADLWLAYTLYQAAAYWGEAQYADAAQRLLDAIEKLEVKEIPGFGWMLFPGKNGFSRNQMHYRLNPSYLAFPLLAYMARIRPNGPWPSIYSNSVKLLRQVAIQGRVPDWVNYDRRRGFFLSDGAVLSFDAIRVYLWAGMLDPKDPYAEVIMGTLSPLVVLLEQGPLAGEIDVYSGEAKCDWHSFAHSAALLPFLARLGRHDLLERERKRLQRAMHGCLIGENPLYYDQNLALFALQWIEGRFAFAADGSLEVSWR